MNLELIILNIEIVLAIRRQHRPDQSSHPVSVPETCHDRHDDEIKQVQKQTRRGKFNKTEFFAIVSYNPILMLPILIHT